MVNTANTRIFNFAVRGARSKLIGGDSGRYERETFVEEVLLAPSERAIIDVLFDPPGKVRLEHRIPDRVYDLERSLFRRPTDAARPQRQRSNGCKRTRNCRPSTAA